MGRGMDEASAVVGYAGKLEGGGLSCNSQTSPKLISQEGQNYMPQQQRHKTSLLCRAQGKVFYPHLISVSPKNAIHYSFGSWLVVKEFTV